jgi:hypothetical protein
MPMGWRRVCAITCTVLLAHVERFGGQRRACPSRGRTGRRVLEGVDETFIDRDRIDEKGTGQVVGTRRIHLRLA